MARLNLQEVEHEMLDFWKKQQIYEKVKEKTAQGPSFYFLDGPPYTSGRVHIGTAWNKALKDAVLRYKRMKGYNVWDRAGYDMHGLPTELKVQDKLGMKHKEEIEAYGVAKFVEACKQFSLENMEQMNKDFERLGVWMDFDHAYKPIDPSFIEGEWWLIKKAHEQGRLYEGEKTMSWCAHCATALAKHELEYKEVEDTSIFLKFKIKGKENEYLIIWTTTPWTIPFNLGIMVNPELEYVKIKVKDEYWIVAKGLVGAFVQGVLNEQFEIVEEMKGEALEGIAYEHILYDELKEIYDALKEKSPKVHTVVLSAEYVDLSAGTGLVHMAPGCGPEDYEVGWRNKIPPFNNLNEYGIFPESMGPFAGWIAKSDDAKFIEYFEQKGAVLAKTPVTHDYAHCWRCKNPVIFKTTKQWFFKVEDLVEEMRKANQEIFWNPSFAKEQFDHWLQNLRDNGITRQRYWGTPLPVWKCDQCGKYTVIGSLKELEEKAGKLPEDLHKPWIDELTIPCSCGGMQKRIPDILDVWIDAGTTAWNCLDYPQKTEQFEKIFPPDFILEGKDQIRGWFNLLFVASMVSMRKKPFKAVYMHGFIQDAQGRKMSKSLGNVISPYEVIDQYGSEVLRYYMIGGADPGVDINYNFDDMKVKARNLGVLWNLQSYLIENAQRMNINPFALNPQELSLDHEERFMLSRLQHAIKEATEAFENYDVQKIPWIGEELYLTLSREYVQYIREKLTKGSEDQKKAVVYVLAQTLLEAIKILAPVIPLLTEKIYQNLRSAFSLETESIHLFDWPSYDEALIDKQLEEAFSLAGSIMQSILAARDEAKYGVRWPMKAAIIQADETVQEKVKSLLPLIATMTNVKEVRFGTVSYEENLTLNYHAVANNYGEQLAPKIIAQFAQESKESVLQHLQEEGVFTVTVSGAPFALRKEHVQIERKAEGFIIKEFTKGLVFLDLTRTPELDAEGYQREIIRRIQVMRKELGLKKDDIIYLEIIGEKEIIEHWDESALSETVGATAVEFTNDPEQDAVDAEKTFTIKGKEFTVRIKKQ